MTALRSSTARGRELIGHVLEEVEPLLRRWVDDAGEMNGRSSRAGPHRGHEVLRSRVASRGECDGAAEFERDGQRHFSWAVLRHLHSGSDETEVAADDELLRAAAHGRDERAGANF